MRILLWILLVTLATKAAGQFFQFQQGGGGGINLEDLMGGAFGGGGGFHGGGQHEELPDVSPAAPTPRVLRPLWTAHPPHRRLAAARTVALGMA